MSAIELQKAAGDNQNIKNAIKARLLQKQLAFFLVSRNKQVWFRNNATIILIDIKSFRNRAFSVKMAGY